MKPVLDDEAFDQLFRSARTYPIWRNRRVTYAQIHALYDRLRYGPTRMNCQPARFLFPCTSESKARLEPALLAGNVAKVKAAPVTAVVAHDSRFFDRLPEVWPRSPASTDMYASNEALAHSTAFRNGTLQGAYLILAARAVGLAAGSNNLHRPLGSPAHPGGDRGGLGGARYAPGRAARQAHGDGACAYALTRRGNR